MNAATPIMFAMVLAVGTQACSSDDPLPTQQMQAIPAAFDPTIPYNPGISASQLDTAITNPLFPAPVGATWLYEAETEDGAERIEISVLSETHDVQGVAARVVRDTVYVDDELVEDTWDWYAQDAEGNVWYLGEDTQEYEDGEVVCECGAWEWGQDDALPGVIMLASPVIAATYRQEYLAGEAEDYARVISLNETVTVPAGTFSGCLKTQDLSAIDTSMDAFKFYCPGVGTVLELEGDVRVELIEYAGL